MLALSAVLGLFTMGALTGCQEQPPAAAPPPLEPDELSIGRAVEAARSLRAQALGLAGTAGTPTATAALLRRVAAVHEAHLSALGAPVATATARPTATRTTVPTSTSPSTTDTAAPTGTGTTTGPPTARDTTPGTTSPSTTNPGTPSPSAGKTAATALAKAEASAARTALRDCLAADGPFAVLLGRIAAARIVNADLINAAGHRKPNGVLKPAAAPTPTPTATGPTPTSSAGGASPTATTPDDVAPRTLRDPDSPSLTALDRFLAGEHAAVFAYPLIVARAADDRRELALTLWQEHRNTRDALAVQLQAAGVQPTVSEPAYAVGRPPTSAAKAAALATRVERGLAALATDLLAAGAAADVYRTQGAAELVLAARRGASWSNRPEAFPGLGSSSATPVPSPTASAAPTTSAPIAPTTISLAPDRPTIFPNLQSPAVP